MRPGAFPSAAEVEAEKLSFFPSGLVMGEQGLAGRSVGGGSWYALRSACEMQSCGPPVPLCSGGLTGVRQECPQVRGG